MDKKTNNEAEQLSIQEAYQDYFHRLSGRCHSSPNMQYARWNQQIYSL